MCELTQKFLLVLFRELKENSPEVLDKLIRCRTSFIGSRLKTEQKKSSIFVQFLLQICKFC